MRNGGDRFAMRRYLCITAALLLVPPAWARAGEGPGAPPPALKASLVSVLQGGADFEALPETHPLAPSRRVPSIATVSWLLLRGDPSMLERFYTEIYRVSTGIFSQERLTGRGFVPGVGPGDAGSGLTCPGMNSLAALELHSLSLIAAAAHRPEEAIEIRGWATGFADAIAEEFFDHQTGVFMPTGPDGRYVERFLPEQLLPLLVYSAGGGRLRRTIAERHLYEARRRYSRGVPPSAWSDPDLRPAVVSLLGMIDGVPPVAADAFVRGGAESPGRPEWRDLWKGGVSREDIFPPCDGIFVFERLMEILVDSEVLVDDLRKDIERDVMTLRSALESSSLDTERHIQAVEAVNRLLVALSTLETALETGERLWKVIDEVRWARISPRTKKVVAAACSTALDELVSSKTGLSSRFLAGGDIGADLVLPDGPVPVTGGLPIEARLWSGSGELRLERIYLQSGGRRWYITGQGEEVALAPGGAPFSWNGTLALSPGTEPGIHPVPAFFDFILEGNRVEIHVESGVILTTGYDVTLTFPEGRKPSGGRLPLGIVIRFSPSRDVRGTVKGVLTGGLESSPELPARFVMESGSRITELPLEISAAGAVPPGVYPFSILVELNGGTVARFEEEVVFPLRWLHLGPLPGEDWVYDRALPAQDDLYGPHSFSGSGELRWKSVDPGAMDPGGAIVPSRLYGRAGPGSSLFYTVIEMPERRRVRWTIETSGSPRLWINSIPIVDGPGSAGGLTGLTVLREGLNTVLLACRWARDPHPVEFSVADENGYPLARMRNSIDEVYDRFARVAATAAGSAARRGEAAQPRKVDFELDLPGASDVSLIGEFNNWEPGATPMVRSSGGVWRATVVLDPGTYSYKFLVDRKRRIADPSSEDSVPDGFGGVSSLIVVE